MNIDLVMMLTEGDCTIPDAPEVYSRVRNFAALKYIAFKDVSADESALTSLTRRAHEDGKTVVLEVADLSPEGQDNGVRLARAIGVDVLISRWSARTAAELRERSIEFWPFLGVLGGIPLELRSTPPEVGREARRFTHELGISTSVLMPYRQDRWSPGEFLAEATSQGEGQIMVAGGVSKQDQFDELERHGVWGVSVGSWLLRDRHERPELVVERLRTVLQAYTQR